jgi:hypothetical protein
MPYKQVYPYHPATISPSKCGYQNNLDFMVNIDQIDDVNGVDTSITSAWSVTVFSFDWALCGFVGVVACFFEGMLEAAARAYSGRELEGRVGGGN